MKHNSIFITYFNNNSFNYVDLMDEMKSSKWELLIEKYGYNSIKEGEYPKIEKGERIEDKKIFSTKEEYDREKQRLKEKCDSITV